MRRKHRVRLLVLPLFVVAFLAASRHSSGFTVDKILAVVDNELITFTDYQRFVKAMGRMENPDTIDESLLKRMIEEKIILLEAMRRGIEVSDIEVDREVALFMEANALTREDLGVILAKEGMNLENYRKLLTDKIRSVKLVHEEVEAKITVTKNDIADYYDGHKRAYLLSREKVEIRAFFLGLDEGASVTEITELKRKALKIHAQLRDGGSFEGLASRHSDKSSAGPEEIRGEFARGELIPPLERKAFLMKKGEVSEPIWVKNGAYILKLLNKTEENFKPIEKVGEEIRSYLYETKKAELFNEWMRALWQRASVTITH